MSTRQSLIHIALGCIVSALLLAIALYLRSEAESFKATAARATATVVDHSDRHWRDSDNDERVDQADVYQFTAASGQVVRFKSLISHSQPRRAIGDHAAALYDPNDPSAARLDDDSRTLIASILLWCSPLGLVFSAIYLWIWQRGRH
jgi:Protein of unknown function (DUF3592)